MSVNELQNIHLVAKRTFESDRPIYLRRYIILGGETRYAALRFNNLSNFVVTGIAFKIRQKGSRGAFISEDRLEFSGLFVLPQNEFPVPDIELSDECVEIDIIVERVYSDNYEYIMEDNYMRANYMPGLDHRKGYYIKKPTCKTENKVRRIFLFILSFIALFFVVAMALAIISAAIREELIVDPFTNIFARVVCYVKK